MRARVQGHDSILFDVKTNFHKYFLVSTTVRKVTIQAVQCTYRSSCSKLTLHTPLCQAAGVLRNLSISAPHGKTMVSDGAVPLLIELLKVQDMKVQEQASGTIRNLSAVPENRATLVQV